MSRTTARGRAVAANGVVSRFEDRAEGPGEIPHVPCHKSHCGQKAVGFCREVFGAIRAFYLAPLDVGFLVISASFTSQRARPCP
jgi:hypothetical protein